jgi:hypothetical protein
VEADPFFPFTPGSHGQAGLPVGGTPHSEQGYAFGWVDCQSKTFDELQGLGNVLHESLQFLMGGVHITHLAIVCKNIHTIGNPAWTGFSAQLQQKKPHVPRPEEGCCPAPLSDSPSYRNRDIFTIAI